MSSSAVCENGLRRKSVEPAVIPPTALAFPTRRSSDLKGRAGPGRTGRGLQDHESELRGAHDRLGAALDRKSTRLNSSHVSISYAVFCLKKNLKKGRHLADFVEQDGSVLC